MRHFTKISSYLTPILLTLTLSPSARAQTPVYHPGQTMRLSITFDGPDAPKISSVVIVCDTPKSPDSQPNFSTQIYPGTSKQIGANTFEISYLIPDTQASGDYTLNQIRGVATVGSGPTQSNVTLFYQSPADFPGRKFAIDNSQILQKPKIKDAKILP